ncbi:WYL domain-containing protein [Oerskovia sp. Sa1BUA8]|uniref:WYL domain-containing protein n=1 Tax=Oerskovia douganii TaxID=2762210 RepID=A0A9D5UAA1_9CELL|nr:WYL domain-containing protein [Oerskovia douganii]MBE7701403.1 WYL domain-containing protein [Oerskovia douganii]
MYQPAGTASRLLALLSLLQARREWPGPVLAGRLGVSLRTVRRDVERLRDMGYEITAGRGSIGGYRLDSGAELPPLLLDDDQVTAIAVALRAVPLAGAGVDEAAGRALATIRRVMPSRLRHRVDALQFTTLTADAPANPAGTADVTDDLVLLSTAIRAREVVRFDYTAEAVTRTGVEGAAATADLLRPPRRAEPHHLVASRGRWYLVAWDLGVADWRIFRVDRMALRAHTGPRFTPRTLPEDDVREFVAARFKGWSANDWPCRGKVVVDLPARAVAPFVEDGVVEDLGPDRCSVEVGSWSWVALAALLGRFEADVHVLQPDELRVAFGELARRFQRASEPGDRPR